MHAARAEEDVDHFLVDLGPLLDLLGGELGILAHPVVRLHQRVDVGHHDLRIFLAKILAHDDAMECRSLGLGAVIDLAGETLERQQLGERHEVAMRVDAFFLQIGGADFRRLRHQVPEIGRQSALLQRRQHHAVRGRAERHRHVLALEVGEFVERRVLVDDDAVAAADRVVGDDGDELRFVLGGLPGGAVHHQRIVAHHADLDVVGHHAVGDRRAGCRVLPAQLVLEILVLAGLRQVLLEQAKLLQNDATGHRVGGGVLCADADFEGFGACRSRRQRDGCRNEQGKEAREFRRRADAH